eukprot:3595250-Rhodomonas_salina.3
MSLLDPTSGKPTAVTLDCCIGRHELQADVWQRVGGAELADRILGGYSVTVLAYGQAGAGKTYTMFGNHTAPNAQLGGDEVGLIPRLITRVLRKFADKAEAEPGKAFTFRVEMSSVEVYLDMVFDLLSDPVAAVRVLDGDKGPVVQGLTKFSVGSNKEALDVVNSAFLRRRVRGTGMNQASSRSHVMVTLHVWQTLERGATKLTRRSEVNLVDLAGSERGRTRKADADFWKGAAHEDHAVAAKKEEEATSINSSLRVLQSVIKGLAAGRAHVPYRECKLTRLLYKALGGKALTGLVTALSPSPDDFSETKNTLAYAREAKKILNMVGGLSIAI